MRRKSMIQNIASRKYAVISFFIVFIFQLIFNTMIVCMRSLPDEMGAVALAADWAGYDWNYVLTHPAKYYGSGTALLLYPFFVFVKNPLILYQCLLGVGAFLHAIPAYIACRIVQKYYQITENKICIIFIGVLCSLFTPTRATNIDNEPMLIVMCWLIIYIMIALIHTNKKYIKSLYSVFLATVLTFSYFSHTRALLYTLAAVLVILIYRIICKKTLINILYFAPTYIGEMFIINRIVKYIKMSLFTSEITIQVANTPEEIVGSALTNTQSLLSLTGARSFFDLLFSNIWIIFVFSGGIILFFICLFIRDSYKTIKNFLNKQFETNDDTSYIFPVAFCVIGILVSLIGLCIIWLPQSMSVHLEESNLSRGHFYLRYYGNYFGPLMLFFIIRIAKVRIDKKKVKAIVIAIAVVSFSAIYSVISYLGMATIRYQYNLDWFYYFAPFSGMLNSWPNTIQTLSYFACATLVSVIILCSVILLIQKKRTKTWLILLIGVFAWQYGYGVSRFDAPYSNSTNYYLSVNSFYDFCEKNKFILNNVNQLYYYNETYGPAYIVQFMIPDKKVITDLSLIVNEDNNIILSNVALSNDIIDLSRYIFLQLDDNEFLYTNDTEKIEYLKQIGMLNY